MGSHLPIMKSENIFCPIFIEKFRAKSVNVNKTENRQNCKFLFLVRDRRYEASKLGGMECLKLNQLRIINSGLNGFQFVRQQIKSLIPDESHRKSTQEYYPQLRTITLLNFPTIVENYPWLQRQGMKARDNIALILIFSFETGYPSWQWNEIKAERWNSINRCS